MDFISEEYPKHGWLRGYFKDVPNDRKSPSVSSVRWRKNIDFLRLRDVALHRLDVRKGEMVLDVGCADGCTMIYCGLLGAEVYGVDLNPKAVEEANSLLAEFDLAGRAECANAESTGFPDNHFDKVISSDFFEHVADEEKTAIFREIIRVLKPGGRLVIKTPNLNYLKLSLRFKQMKALLSLQNPLKLYIPHTPGTDDPQHIGLASRKSLDKCLEEGGYLDREYFYSPLRRFGSSYLVGILSTEIPVVRDYLCEDLFCIARKPVVLSYFPD